VFRDIFSRFWSTFGRFFGDVLRPRCGKRELCLDCAGVSGLHVRPSAKAPFSELLACFLFRAASEGVPGGSRGSILAPFWRSVAAIWGPWRCFWQFFFRYCFHEISGCRLRSVTVVFRSFPVSTVAERAGPGRGGGFPSGLPWCGCSGGDLKRLRQASAWRGGSIRRTAPNRHRAWGSAGVSAKLTDPDHTEEMPAFFVFPAPDSF